MKWIPLPEVSEHTDRIVVGELGLPVGFDPEQLELQVPRVERICQHGRLGQPALSGYRGETTEYAYGVGGIDASGVATATKSVSASKAKVSRVELNDANKQFPERYRWQDAKIEFNNAEIEERIKNDDDKWDKGLFDPAARAKYMNQALKYGLANATNESLIGDIPYPIRVAMSMGWFATLTTLWKWGHGFTTQEAAVVAYGVGHAVSESYNTYKASRNPNWPPRQRSIFSDSTPVDRHLLALGLTAQSKLIRAKK